MWETMTMWSRRRWYAAAAAAVATVLVIAVPTAMIPTPIFGRQIPPTWWSWPVLVVTAAMSGLLLATYVRQPGDAPAAEDAEAQLDKKGVVGGFLTYLAVGCPVCNKIALIALGSAGALQWFAPIQPYLGVAALAVLAWGLKARLDGERACPVPAATRS
jgi:hypothetical protein